MFRLQVYTDKMSDAFVPCPLEEVIVPPAASGATTVPPGKAETDAFLELSRTLAKSPEKTAQRLVDIAMSLTGADSAGLSLEEVDEDTPIFRWVATCGEFSRYANGTMPRDFSPCGTTIKHRRPLLMRDPVRHYAYISQLHAPVRSVALVPFARAGKWIGTIWIVAHTAEKVFDERDIAMVKKLTTFASAVLDSQAGKTA